MARSSVYARQQAYAKDPRIAVNFLSSVLRCHAMFSGPSPTVGINPSHANPYIFGRCTHFWVTRPPPAFNQCFMSSEAAAAGLTLNLDKSGLFWPQRRARTVLGSYPSRILPNQDENTPTTCARPLLNTEGIKVLGTPIGGSHYVRRTCDTIVAKAIHTMKTLVNSPITM